MFLINHNPIVVVVLENRFLWLVKHIIHVGHKDIVADCGVLPHSGNAPYFLGMFWGKVIINILFSSKN